MIEKIRKWFKDHSYKERCWEKCLESGRNVCYGMMGGDWDSCGLSYTCIGCKHLTIYIGENKQ